MIGKKYRSLFILLTMLVLTACSTFEIDIEPAPSYPTFPPQAQIGQFGGDVVSVYSDADAIIDVQWVDAGRYLFLEQWSGGWAIMLGEIGGPVKNVAGMAGSYPAYDFAAPIYDSAASTTSTPAAAPPTPASISIDPDSLIPFGLIYQTGDGCWHVNANGESVRILDRVASAWFAISPDGDQVLCDEADDIWLADAATGERRNVTQTPDRSECCAQWWPGQSEIILFNSSLIPETKEPRSYGFPTVARLDGSNYIILGGGATPAALPAPSPDGQTVAYDRAGQPWLYRPDTGPEPFDLTPYNLANVADLMFGSPAWSPDGSKLAWLLVDTFAASDGWSISVGVFDLETRTVSLLYSYVAAGQGGWPLAPAWSPDGQWLIFTALGRDSEIVGLRIVRADGQADHHLSQYNSPVWNPDGRSFVCGSWSQDLGSEVRLVEVGTWASHPLGLPSDAYPVGWASSPGN